MRFTSKGLYDPEPTKTYTKSNDRRYTNIEIYIQEYIIVL